MTPWYDKWNADIGAISADLALFSIMKPFRRLPLKQEAVGGCL